MLTKLVSKLCISQLWCFCRKAPKMDKKLLKLTRVCMVCDRCCVGWLKNNLKVDSFLYVFLLMLIILSWVQSPSSALVYFRLILSCQERRFLLQSSVPLKASHLPLYLDIYFLARALGGVRLKFLLKRCSLMNCVFLPSFFHIARLSPYTLHFSLGCSYKLCGRFWESKGSEFGGKKRMWSSCPFWLYVFP